MAKKEVAPPRYPSEYGSHAVMIDELGTQALDNPEMVVCVDDYGPYATKKSYVDSGSADPNRWDYARIEKVKKEKAEKDKK